MGFGDIQVVHNQETAQTFSFELEIPHFVAWYPLLIVLLLKATGLM